MWAFRRAANPARSNSTRILVSRAGLDKSVTQDGSLKHRDCGYNHKSCCCCRCCASGGRSLPKPLMREPSVSASTSFWWSRNLSSQAGERSSDSEDELGEGFSDLEVAPEDGNIGGSVDRDVEELVGTGEASEDDPEDALSASLGLLDEPEGNGEKDTEKRKHGSSLFKALENSPRHLIDGVLDKWVEEGKSLGRGEVSVALLNLRKRRFYGKALQLVEWLDAKKHFNLIERDYASHLDLIAKVHGLQKAEKYIEKVPESFRGEQLYRTLIANCVAATNVKKAEEVFNKIRDLGLPITTFSCNQLLLLYKRIDRKKIADVLLMMEKDNIKPSLFTYRLLLDTKGRANDMSGMEQILETMKAEGIEPDLFTHATIARHYIDGGLKEKALTALKEIEGDDIKENRDACKVLLPLYASLHRADDVARVWKVCEENPRLVECLAAIEAWGKLGRIEDAERVFEHMITTWKNLSTKYYNVLLKVYANNKLLTKGKDLAKRMSDSGCRIGPLTWDALVKLYIESGEVEKADSILQKAAQQNQTRPLYSSYLALLDKYASRGDIHNAEKIFHRLRQIGYVGRMRQYQALLQAYMRAKAPAYGFRERMKADNMFPNKAVAAQLSAVDAFKKTQMSELLD